MAFYLSIVMSETSQYTTYTVNSWVQFKAVGSYVILLKSIILTVGHERYTWNFHSAFFEFLFLCHDRHLLSNLGPFSK